MNKIIISIFILIGQSLQSENILFQKKIDDGKLVVIASEPQKTNSSNLNKDKRDILPPALSLLARALLVLLPVSTNVLWERFYLSTDYSRYFGFYPTNAAKYAPIKIFDVYYNSTNGQFAILWVEQCDHIYCQIGKTPPFPVRVEYKDKNLIGIEFLQYEIKVDNHSLSYWAENGEIIYDDKTGKIKVKIKTTKDKELSFLWSEKGWVEIK